VTWKKLWVLFSVIWVIVAGLNAATILAFSSDESEKAWRPVVLGVAVPALLYLIGLGWQWLRKKRKGSSAG